jgi:hypothetical protein
VFIEIIRFTNILINAFFNVYNALFNVNFKRRRLEHVDQL